MSSEVLFYKSSTPETHQFLHSQYRSHGKVLKILLIFLAFERPMKQNRLFHRQGEGSFQSILMLSEERLLHSSRDFFIKLFDISYQTFMDVHDVLELKSMAGLPTMKR